MIKNKQTNTYKLGIEGMFLNNKKFNICQAHIIFKGKKLKSFPIRSRTPKKKKKTSYVVSKSSTKAPRRRRKWQPTPVFLPRESGG